jgi:hypothetical protein
MEIFQEEEIRMEGEHHFRCQCRYRYLLAENSAALDGLFVLLSFNFVNQSGDFLQNNGQRVLNRFG